MEQVILTVSGVSKTFNRRKIFSGISFECRSGQAVAVTGRNGSGKSTLMKILCGVLSPGKGTVTLAHNGTPVPLHDRHLHIGLVSPYLYLYDEFTGIENLRLVRDIRGVRTREEELNVLLERVGLLDRRNDQVRTYSSGMKQRLKYAFALLHHPPVLILDEPTSNLDEQGSGVVDSIMQEQKQGGILIVATNDRDDLRFCDSVVDLNAQGTGGSR